MTILLMSLNTYFCTRYYNSNAEVHKFEHIP